MPNTRQRLDLLLIEKGLATTRTKSQELIRAGKVIVAGKVARSPGEKVSCESEISLTEKEHPYVSRGGLKLEAALLAFGIDVKGLRALDVGQSTGGFTHCLLRRGANEVVGVEVGRDQLAEELRGDSRVHTHEKQDIRLLAPELVGAPFAFFVVDLSFISLSLVLPVLPRFLNAHAEGIVLVKPQFEVGPDHIGSGGIVRDAAARERALELVRLNCRENGFTVAGSIPSPVMGGDGNQEFLFYLKRTSQAVGN